MSDIVIIRSGRPRTRGLKRDATSARSRGEPVEAIRAVVNAQRHKFVGGPAPLDPLAGHALGRLRQAHQSRGWGDPMSISEDQFNAAQRFARLSVRHAQIMGYSTGSPRSAMLDLVGGGLSCAKEPDEEAILEVRRNWSDAYGELMHVGKLHNRGAFIAIATYDICLERRAFESLDAQRVGDLRIGLNALIQLWRKS